VAAAAAEIRGDRFGLSWRPLLAAGIFEALERIDVLELMADDHFRDSDKELRALRTLAQQRPVHLHGTGLGLASASPPPSERLERLARLVGVVEPESWSEHLAFVRAGGIELGHLAAPPRSRATLDGTAANVMRASRVVGSLPQLENVATLIDPPGSDRDELAFVTEALRVTGAPLLLDLHNLYANAHNFGFDPHAFLSALPLDRLGSVHLAGGRWCGLRDRADSRRWLDDHLHPVPGPVFELLEALAARAPSALTVVLERDGAYPPMAELLAELDQARAAVTRGRARQAASRTAGAVTMARAG
jgi:uncharacterized protein (UPF0276 family)